MKVTKSRQLLESKERRKINAALHSQFYKFTETLGEGVSMIEDVLDTWGFETEWSMLGGVAYQTSLRETLPMISQVRGPMDNSMLVVSIYRMPSGRYEWTVYAT